MEESKILSCAWMWSEGSGDNYVFSKEALLGFAKELLSQSHQENSKSIPPAQGEREKPFAWFEMGEDGERGFLIVDKDRLRQMKESRSHHFYHAYLVDPNTAARPAQTEQQPEQSGACKTCDGRGHVCVDWEAGAWDKCQDCNTP